MQYQMLPWHPFQLQETSSRLYNDEYLGGRCNISHIPLLSPHCQQPIAKEVVNTDVIYIPSKVYVPIGGTLTAPARIIFVSLVGTVPLESFTGDSLIKKRKETKKQ